METKKRDRKAYNKAYREREHEYFAKYEKSSPARIRRRESVKARVRDFKVRCLEYKGNVCARCGVKYDGANSAIFDFHHLDPKTKEMTICYGYTRNFDKVKQEMNKCILVCSNCHRLIHFRGELYGETEN